MPADTKLSSAEALWTGRICSGLMIAFLTFDAATHLAKIQPVTQAFTRLGLPLNLAVPLGIIELACVAVYAYPRTSVLGAILLTGYLAGAVAMQLRAGSSLFGETLFPVCVGILVWGGLYVRRPRLRRLLPIRKSPASLRAPSRKMLLGRPYSEYRTRASDSVRRRCETAEIIFVEGYRQAGYAEHLVSESAILR